MSALCTLQELCELAQRKFLRQLVLYAELQDMLPYPHLFLVDFAKAEGETGVCVCVCVCVYVCVCACVCLCMCCL